MVRLLQLACHDDYEGWRREAKAALNTDLRPEEVRFQIAGNEEDLFSDQTRGDVPAGPVRKPPVERAITVPSAFPELAKQIVCHSHPERFAILYQLLWRLQKDRFFLKQDANELMHRANVLAKEVRRDAHKMKAFVRFRETGEASGGEYYVAWFEPSHHIVRYTSRFFMRRFTSMQWSILTPKGCAHWNRQELTFSPPAPRSAAPAGDALEEYWKSYYASIFNPARLKIDAMRAEMPEKYWKNLPEAELIPGLVTKARNREQHMVNAAPSRPRSGMMAHRAASAKDEFPARHAIENLDDLRNAVKGCRSCPLWRPATQTVPGCGKPDANVMLVGEQPGDQEDLLGRPFIGPAGQVLRDAMGEIGRDLDHAYVTNAVKHFKFEPRGKRRLHKTPAINEIEQCKWWLDREIELVKPKVIVALGRSAVRALTGKAPSIVSLRGAVHPLPIHIGLVVANHPSYILRLPDKRAQQDARQALTEDLDLAFSSAASL